MEFFLLKVDEVVVYLAFVGEGGVELQYFVLDGVTKLDSRVVFWVVAQVGPS